MCGYGRRVRALLSLPAEAAEALLELATGGVPQEMPAADEKLYEIPYLEVEAKVLPANVGPAVSFPELQPEDPFEHPDAKRRFRVMNDVEELERALEYPWERWTVFLHPEQRRLVKRDYSGPARVSGSAGTGKTVVALHRAAFLARTNPDARVLLSTFSDALANSLRTKLMRLISSEPRLGERLEVHSIDAIGERLYKSNVGPVDIAPRDVVRDLLEGAADAVEGHRFSLGFLLAEWEQVVDAWQVATWEEYRDIRRLGRKTRLPEGHRRVLWEIFAGARSGLEARSLITRADMFTRLASYLKSMRHPPFDFAVVDEAQDISVAQLRFLAALGNDRLNSLFFAGDLGQRIFQQPFSWKSLGVDIRGRSRTLRVNYRTSHQIRTQADLLLGSELVDVDGVAERRSGTVSVFNVPEPTIRVLDGIDEEIRVVSAWLSERITEGVVPHEIGVFVRSPAQLERARAVVEEAGLPFKVLDEKIETASGRVSISTMHLAKGLEFRAVVVMACDDEVIPLQARIETVADESDLLEVYNTERHLLYVACTRARDFLLVTSSDTPSEFLDDLRM
jgi:superfamily I DNA/RNA helicase